MILSKRLERVVANVKLKGVVADIGCDHGFTGIELLQRGISKYVIAMDINKGPIERAKEHIFQYNMQDKMETRLSDGADKLFENEADTVIISGLGGALMRKILWEKRNVFETVNELVLSPQSEIFLVRKVLHEMGFMIASEEMVYDQGKYYVIIRAIRGEEKYADADYFFGRKLIESKDIVFLQYLQSEKTRLEKVLLSMSEKKLSDTGKEKREALAKTMSKIDNIILMWRN